METEVKEEVAAPTEVVATPDATTKLNDMFDKNLSDFDETPNDAPDGKPANAPSEGNLKEPEKTPDAPVVGEPAEKEASTKPETEEKPPVEAEKKDDEGDALFNALIDAPVEESIQDIGVLKTRYSDATRRIGELNDQVREINEVLASAGRQIIRTKDGIKVAIMDNAPELSPDAIDMDVFKTLTTAEQDLFTDDPAKAARLIAEKTVKQVAEKFVPAQATAKDVILSQGEVDTVYTDFVASRLPDGKTPRFQDADNAEVRDAMAKAFNSTTPAMVKFKELAAKDKDIHHIMLEHLFNKVFRARHAKLSVLAASKKAATDIKTKNAAEPKISSSGASQSVKGQETGRKPVDVQGMFDAGLDDL